MTRLRTLIVLLAWMMGLASGATKAAESAALVTDLEGTAATVDGKPLTILSEVGAPSRIELRQGARVVLLHLGQGAQFEVRGPGSVAVTAAGIEATGVPVVRKAIMQAGFEGIRLRPSRSIQASASMRGRGSATDITLLTPAGSWVTAERPKFRWAPVDSVEGSYRWVLSEPTGRVLADFRTRDTEFSLPAGVELVAGQTYGWQVTARLADGRVAEGWAEFGLADAGRRARAREARPAADASFSDRVVYALLLDELGLHEDAHSMWALLASERQDVPALRSMATQK